VAETPIATPSFAAWMRPRRALYGVLFAGICAGLLATALLFLRARLVPVPALDAAWYQVEPFAWLYSMLGLPIVAQLVLLPLLVAALVAVAVLAFEYLVFRLGIDRGDHAWSSLAWTWRSWPMAVAWVPVSMAWSWLGVWLAVEGIDAYWAQAIVQAAFATGASLLLRLFAWNAASLVRPRAPYVWRPRWPTWSGPAISVATAAVVISTLYGLLAAAPLPPALWALAPLAIYVLLAVTALAALPWISRGRMPARDVLRLAAGRATAAMALQGLRLLVLVALASLWVLPMALSLAWIAPQFEFALKDYGSLLPDAWMQVVHASRFTVKWWWLGAWTSLTVWQYGFAWFGTVATGRLLVERRWVGDDLAQSPGKVARNDAPTPSTHPDSGPAATIPPTA
jgi:hypothetical protein